MKYSLFAAVGTLAGLVRAQSTTTNCSIFNWDRQPAYFSTYPARRISGASYCPESTPSNATCIITASGDVQVPFQYNLSSLWLNTQIITSSSVDSWVHKVVFAAVNASISNFTDGAIGAIDTSLPLEPGQAAYINFEPLKKWVAGTVANCSGTLQDGTAIEACTAVQHTVQQNGVSILDRINTLVNISASNVSQFRDPFANQAHSSGSTFGAGLFAVGLGILVAFGGLELLI